MLFRSPTLYLSAPASTTLNNCSLLQFSGPLNFYDEHDCNHSNREKRNDAQVADALQGYEYEWAAVVTLRDSLNAFVFSEVGTPST